MQQQRRFGSPSRDSSVSQVRNPIILDAFAGETLNGKKTTFGIKIILFDYINTRNNLIFSINLYL